jgi:hypothetical protein
MTTGEWRVKLVGRPGWKRRTVPVHAYVLIYRAGNTPAVVYKIHRDLLNRLGKLNPIYMETIEYNHNNISLRASTVWSTRLEKRHDTTRYSAHNG